MGSLTCQTSGNGIGVKSPPSLVFLQDPSRNGIRAKFPFSWDPCGIPHLNPSGNGMGGNLPFPGVPVVWFGLIFWLAHQ